MAGSVLQNLRQGFLQADMLRRLIFINIGVYLVLTLYFIIARFSGNLDWLSVSGTDLFLASTSGLEDLIYRPWSVVTYMFTHVDFWHIAFNLIVLYWFGSLFQQYIGQRKLLSVYLLSGFSGLLLYIITYNVFPGLTAGAGIMGASAAIMGIVIGIAAFQPNLRMNLLLLGPVKLQYIAIFYVIMDFVSLRSLDNTGGHLAHLGGALFGFLWAMQFRSGKDISAGFERFLDKFFLLFRPGGASFRVIRNNAKATRTTQYKSDEEYNAEKHQRQEKIDAILDKISKAGYDSLSKAEKDFLFRHSK